MQRSTSTKDRAEDRGCWEDHGAIRKIVLILNRNVIFPLYFILEGKETGCWNKFTYILHSYTAIVYLSPNKIYDNLVDKMENIG